MSLRHVAPITTRRDPNPRIGPFRHVGLKANGDGSYSYTLVEGEIEATLTDNGDGSVSLDTTATVATGTLLLAFPDEVIHALKR